jgi:DNA-binding beta-propeller fold protein YncE
MNLGFHHPRPLETQPALHPGEVEFLSLEPLRLERGRPRPRGSGGWLRAGEGIRAPAGAAVARSTNSAASDFLVPFRRFGAGLPLAGLLLLGVLPGSAKPVGATNPPPAWPPPPAEPRVVYVRAIACPADIGAKPSTLNRVADWFTGAGKDKGKLDKPFGLSLDDSGNLLVTDTGANTVSLLNLARKKWTRWETIGRTRFKSPVAIAAHGRTIFVADSALGKVIAFNEQGKLQFEITNELERPSGLAVIGDKIYISDAQRHHVVICDRRGTFGSKFGQRGTGPGEFNFPTHVSADAGGRLYVTDSLNNRIQVFDAEGRFLRAFGSVGDGPGSFSRPKGVAADTDGHLYVVDAVFDNVQVFDDQGQLLMNWGEAGPDPGQFWLPNAIAISRANEIYVADTHNQRIQVFRYVGKP